MQNQIAAYVEANKESMLAELQAFVRQPSISSQNIGVRECAQLAAEMLRRRGARVEIWETDGHPTVFGEITGAGTKRMLMYSHYDVQPPEPLDAWLVPPFEAAVLDGRLIARGVSDHKGNFVARLHAIDALLSLGEPLPLTVKFILEGEEEVSSKHLLQTVRTHREQLLADAGLYAGGEKDDFGNPLIYAGSKGIVYVELTCQTASTDMHSRWAALVPNPAWRLLRALATLKDENERILIEGFYDEIMQPGEVEREALKRIPFDEPGVKQRFGVDRFIGGVEGDAVVEQLLFAPTCNIAGVWSGYTGQGSKTVLPHIARAKLDIRLVPNQSAHDIVAKLRAHLDRHGFADIAVEPMGMNDASGVPIDHPLVRAVAGAVQAVYGREAIVYPNRPGSGPRYIFARELALPIIDDPGVSHTGGNHHAPNENIRLQDYYEGVCCMAEFLRRFAQEG